MSTLAGDRHHGTGGQSKQHKEGCMEPKSTSPNTAHSIAISVCLSDHDGKSWRCAGLHSKCPFGLAKRLQQPGRDEPRSC